MNETHTAPRTIRTLVPPSDEAVKAELAGGPMAEPTYVELTEDQFWNRQRHPMTHAAAPWELRRLARAHVAYGWGSHAGPSCGGPTWTSQQKNFYLDEYDREAHKQLPIERQLFFAQRRLASWTEKKLRYQQTYDEGVAEGPAARNMWGREQQLNEAKRETARLTRLIAKIKTENKL